MSDFAEQIERVAAHLTINTTTTLYAASINAPMFCRKYFSVESLKKLIRAEWRGLQLAGLLDRFREEVVTRYLIRADRLPDVQQEFANLLREQVFSDPGLLQFVNDCYVPRQLDNFASTEAEYLARLREVRRERSPLHAAIDDALAWFGVGASRRRLDSFRVLFSNHSLITRFPGVLRSAMALTFTFRGNNGTQPFDADDRRRLGDVFCRTARDAELEAYGIRGEEFADRKHRQASIEASYEDVSILDGSSGYLAFLMAHTCLLEGVPLSPYVGFTGARKEFGRLDRVRDLKPKLVAAIQAGMRVIFVPMSDYRELTPAIQRGYGVIDIRAFDDHGHSEEVAQKLLEQLRELESVPADSNSERTVSEPNGQTPVVVPIKDVVDAGLDRLREAQWVQADASSLEIIDAPRPLFRSTKLKVFQECGGFKFDTYSQVSAVNSADDTFVTLFPERDRLYLFNSLGGLLRKQHSRDNKPICIAWRDEPAEYLISFANGTVGRYDAVLKDEHGRYRLPSGAVGQSMITAARDVYLCDDSGRLFRLPSDPGATPQLLATSGAVSSLAYDASSDSLVIAVDKDLIGLNRHGGEIWRVGLPAKVVTVACSPYGDVWAVLMNSRLLRMAKRENSPTSPEVLVDVPTLSSVVGLIVLERALVVAAESGEIALHNPQGREIGRDSLKVKLCHVATGEGNLLVLSTGIGPTILQPLPSLLQTTDAIDSSERVLHTVRELETAANNGNMSAIKKFVNSLDLGRWPDVVALQRVIEQKRSMNPALVKNLQTLVSRVDSRKAAVLFSRTKPVFVDGSNVSRDHWRGSKAPNRVSRFSAILSMQKTLAAEHNPVLYPIITVVDLSERRWSDNRADLVRQIDEGITLEAPSEREADALILNYIQRQNWLDCEIVSNDKKMFEAHHEMFPEASQQWYEKVRRAFVIHPKTKQITFVQASR